MTFDRLISELNYTSSIEQTVRQKIRKREKWVREIAETAYQGEDLNFNLCKRMPLTRLSVVTCLLLGQYEAYKAKGIPEYMILDTFKDVSLRANLYYEKTGKVGITKDDVIWFRHIMNVAIFKIGALQFQPFEMLYLDEETIGEPYMTFSAEQKEALPAGTPVLNCHIQRGADLNGQSVEDSLQSAKLFFSQYFPAVAYKAFLCYSWLLYPPMVENLPAGSNIRQFAKRYSIIGYCNDPEQALTNLFEDGANKGARSITTSLQKLAAEHLELLGVACGVIAI